MPSIVASAIALSAVPLAASALIVVTSVLIEPLNPIGVVENAG
jgi:hypothetical protein